MPSTKTESETSNEPWSGYQPFLTGTGKQPDWLTKPPPQGLSDAMAIQNDAWASGSPDSWLQGMPTTQTESGAPQLDFYGDINVPGSPADVPTGGAQPPPEGLLPVDQMNDWWENKQQQDWLANLQTGNEMPLMPWDQANAQQYAGSPESRAIFDNIIGMYE